MRYSKLTMFFTLSLSLSLSLALPPPSPPHPHKTKTKTNNNHHNNKQGCPASTTSSSIDPGLYQTSVFNTTFFDPSVYPSLPYSYAVVAPTSGCATSISSSQTASYAATTSTMATQIMLSGAYNSKALQIGFSANAQVQQMTSSGSTSNSKTVISGTAVALGTYTLNSINSIPLDAGFVTASATILSTYNLLASGAAGAPNSAGYNNTLVGLGTYLGNLYSSYGTHILHQIFTASTCPRGCVCVRKHTHTHTHAHAHKHTLPTPQHKHKHTHKHRAVCKTRFSNIRRTPINYCRRWMSTSNQRPPSRLARFRARRQQACLLTPRRRATWRQQAHSSSTRSRHRGSTCRCVGGWRGHRLNLGCALRGARRSRGGVLIFCFPTSLACAC